MSTVFCGILWMAAGGLLNCAGFVRLCNMISGSGHSAQHLSTQCCMLALLHHPKEILTNQSTIFMSCILRGHYVHVIYELLVNWFNQYIRNIHKQTDWSNSSIKYLVTWFVSLITMMHKIGISGSSLCYSWEVPYAFTRFSPCKLLYDRSPVASSSHYRKLGREK